MHCCAYSLNYSRLVMLQISNLTRWTVRGFDSTPDKLDATEQQVGGTALILFLANPLTWIMIYFFFEGSVRTCGAAFTDSVLGTVPLYVLERSLSFVRNPAAALSPEGIKRNVRSFAESLRERFLTARLREVPDELRYTGNALGEMLEILASRRKAAWVIPQIVRVDGNYYRLEEVSLETGARPFRYRLKRLEAGVTGRTVILYKSGDGITTRD
jgi:hypothetical protein